MTVLKKVGIGLAFALVFSGLISSIRKSAFNAGKSSACVLVANDILPRFGYSLEQDKLKEYCYGKFLTDSEGK
jgi:hypothetical protein